MDKRFRQYSENENLNQEEIIDYIQKYVKESQLNQHLKYSSSM